jgi:hypothetical protein
MSQHDRPWRLRVRFEPNRFSGERLIEVYARLKPPESRVLSKECTGDTKATKRRSAKGGGR